MNLEFPLFEVCLKIKGRIETKLVESSDNLDDFIIKVLGEFEIPSQEKISRITYKDQDGDIIDITNQTDWICAIDIVSEKRAESKQYILRIDIELSDPQIYSDHNNQHDFLGNQEGQHQENFNLNTIYADYSEKNRKSERESNNDVDRNDSWHLLSSQQEINNIESDDIEMLKSKAESIANDLQALKEIEKQSKVNKMKSLVNRIKTNISSQMDANAHGCHTNFLSKENFEFASSREEVNYLQLQSNLLSKLEVHVEKSFDNIRDYLTKIAYSSIRKEIKAILKSEGEKEESLEGNSHQLAEYESNNIAEPIKEYKPFITIVDPKVTVEIIQKVNHNVNPCVYFRIITDTLVDLKIYSLELNILHPTKSITASIYVSEEFLIPDQSSTLELQIDQSYPIIELKNSEGKVNFAASICLIHRVTKSVICLLSPNVIEIEFIFVNSELNSLVQAIRLEYGLSIEEYPDQRIKDALAKASNVQADAFQLLIE